MTKVPFAHSAFPADPRAGQASRSGWLRRRLARPTGIWEVVALATIGSVFVSMLIAYGVTYWILGGEMGFDSWMITLLCPVLISMPVSWATFRIVQELYVVQDQLSELSERDSLTRLHNRRHFMRALNEEIERARRYGGAFSVAILDIDNFKSINDRWGHLSGDQVICDVAQACAQELRQSDVLARIGGEEFAMLLRETPVDAAEGLFERVRKAVAGRAVHLDDHTRVHVTVSIGAVSPIPGAVPDLTDILRRADQALYEAKDCGKDRVVSFREARVRVAARA